MFNIIILDKNNEQKCIIENISFADTFIKRLLGLMGKNNFNGLIFKQEYHDKYSGSIHTCFMKKTIEVLYLNKKHEIQEIKTLTPWKLHIPRKDNIEYIIELPENTTRKYNIKLQDKIILKKK